MLHWLQHAARSCRSELKSEDGPLDGMLTDNGLCDAAVCSAGGVALFFRHQQVLRALCNLLQLALAMEDAMEHDPCAA